MNISKTGIPDGAGEQGKTTRAREIRTRGESGPMNAAPDFSDTKVGEGQEPMSSNLRKGAFGTPISAKGPTTMPSQEEIVPLEAGSQDAVKYGLGKGPQGAI